MFLRLFLLAHVVGASMAPASEAFGGASCEPNDTLRGAGLVWHTLLPGWNASHPLDFASIEWDYSWFSAANGASGVLSLISTNPRNESGEVVPSAIALFSSLWPAGRAPVASFEFFPFDGKAVVVDPCTKRTELLYANGTRAAVLEPLPPGGLRLAGSSPAFSWDLTIDLQPSARLLGGSASQAAALVGEEPGPAGPSAPPFSPLHASDMPLGQSWNIVMWPLVAVRGTAQLRDGSTSMAIDGSGYHDNAWGRFLLPTSGWDVAFTLPNPGDPNGITLTLTSYQTSEEINRLDAAFLDGGQPVKLTMYADRGEVMWEHPRWEWSARARQCVPTSMVFEGRQGGYEVSGALATPLRNASIVLSDAVPGLADYFLIEYPGATVALNITHDGEQVAAATQAAEWGMAYPRATTAEPLSPQQCEEFGRAVYRHDF